MVKALTARAPLSKYHNPSPPPLWIPLFPELYKLDSRCGSESFCNCTHHPVSTSTPSLERKKKCFLNGE